MWFVKTRVRLKKKRKSHWDFPILFLDTERKTNGWLFTTLLNNRRAMMQLFSSTSLSLFFSKQQKKTRIFFLSCLSIFKWNDISALIGKRPQLRSLCDITFAGVDGGCYVGVLLLESHPHDSTCKTSSSTLHSLGTTCAKHPQSKRSPHAHSERGNFRPRVSAKIFI